jgi:hypothetical protein
MNRQEVVKAFAIAAVALPTLLLGAAITASSQIRDATVPAASRGTAPSGTAYAGRCARRNE